MSKILKKSLSLVLVMALCLSAFVGCFNVSAADAETATATYRITFGTVSNDRVTATVNVSSTKNDLAALLFTLDLPGLPVTGVSTDSVYELDTYPDYENGLPMNGLSEIRVLLNAKNTGATYNYANFNITFDVSSKALVSIGLDPDVASVVSTVVNKLEAASYNTGSDGFEGDTWTKVAEDANKNSAGLASASISVKGSCQHNYDSTVVSKPTCKVEGVTHHKCKLCGREYDEKVATIAHTWDNGAETKKASCIVPGVKTYTCTVCGATKDEEIPAIGHHTYVEKYDGNEEHFRINAGTCQENGTAYAICTVCGELSKDPIDIGPGNHEVTAWDEEVPATCGTAGYKVGTCDYCFEEVRVETDPATGNHTWDAGVVTTEPTATTPGVKTYTCTVCKHTKTEEIPVISECEHKNLSAAAYESNANGTYDAVIRCADCGEVVYTLTTDIPATTAVNSNISITRSIEIGSTIGITYMTTNSQLTSYSSYGIRIFRKACDSDYNIDTVNCGELTEFTKYGSKKKYTVYRGIGLYELNLPVVAVLCGYDASGNLVAVSNPMDNNITDFFWNLYNASGATAVQQTFHVDMMNLASEAQTYFAGKKSGCGLESVQLPNAKYAFDQSKATQSLPDYDLSTMPDALQVNSNSTVNTTTYGLLRSLSLATGSPVIAYNMKNANSSKKGKLDMNKLVLEVSYTNGYGNLVSKTVTGSTATDTTDPWVPFSTYLTYTFSACSLYDTNKTITAKFTYDGVEMYTSVYSVETFIANNYGNESEGPLLTSIGKFGVSARAFFGVN